MSVLSCLVVLLIATVSAVPSGANHVGMPMPRRLLADDDLTGEPYNHFTWYTDFKFPKGVLNVPPSLEGVVFEDCTEACLDSPTCQVVVYYFYPTKWAGECYRFNSTAANWLLGTAYDTPQATYDLVGNGLALGMKKK